MIPILRVSFFLALRYVRRMNKWLSLFIVLIMTLTYLNIIVVRGILLGLPEGALKDTSNQYAGDVIIKAHANRPYIDNTKEIEQIIPTLQGYISHSSRYIRPIQVEANYTLSKKGSNLSDVASGLLVGIDPEKEDIITNLSKYVYEGEYLDSNDTDKILIGKNLIDRYSLPMLANETLSDIYPGDKVRLRIGDIEKEFTVKGILSSKVNIVAQRVYMLDTEMRKLINRYDYNVNEIAIHIDTNLISLESFKSLLSLSNFDEYGQAQTAKEASGSFFDDILNTFNLLSNVIGIIGLVVAVITIFIVIFIIAITRQKQIGILKGIGINTLAIELSYVFLAIFYALIGIGIGTFILLAYILPTIVETPIDFPFADGILYINLYDNVVRSILLLLTTIIAGYIPARIIAQKNTINAILGR